MYTSDIAHKERTLSPSFPFRNRCEGLYVMQNFPSQNIFMSTHISRLCYSDISLGTGGGGTHSRALVRHRHCKMWNSIQQWNISGLQAIYKVIYNVRYYSFSENLRCTLIPFWVFRWCKYEVYIGRYVHVPPTG